MLLAFVITVHLSTGQILTNTKQVHTPNQRPVKSLSQCEHYAYQMQKRMNISVKDSNYIKHVTVSCARLPKNQVITQHPPGIKVKRKKHK